MESILFTFGKLERSLKLFAEDVYSVIDTGGSEENIVLRNFA